MDDYLLPDPHVAACEREFSRNLEKMLYQLEINQARVIRMRFGLFGLEELTLDDIGRRFELSRERIRQIETQALKALRILIGFGTDERAKKSTGRKLDDSRQVTAAATPAITDSEPEARHFGGPYKAPTLLPESTTAQYSSNVRPVGSLYVEKLLAKAAVLGLPVLRLPLGERTEFWVNTNEIRFAPDSKVRTLLRNLINMGFVYVPGKGYRK
jgi:RNA polymerase primary sigma factor